jgi:hypothetical protein
MFAQAGIPAGSAKVEVELDGITLDLFTYKPAACKGILMVFHGVLRNAEEYRDDARGMADRFGMLVVAPRFGSREFGSGMYQQGGIFRNGKVVEEKKWTFSLVPRLVEKVRAMEKNPDMPLYLIGHSGGGQFLGRMSAFVSAGAKRVVVANPGSYIVPTREMEYPYGFGKLPEDLADDEQIRLYLARPLTLYLGTGDVMRDSDLDKSSAADREGATRYERGVNTFHAAQTLATRKGWEFNWRLVEAPGVNHDHKAMFDAPACEAALFGPVSKN